MLYYKYQSCVNDDIIEESLYCGVDEAIYRMHNKAINVISVQADGNELELILNRIELPHTVHFTRVVKWFGEDARFIAGNFPTT